MQRNHDYEGVPQDAPIVRQPRATMAPPEQWMSIPVGIPNCPTGLEYLTAVDQLLITQKVTPSPLASVRYGCKGTIESKIKNSLGQNVYVSMEDTSCPLLHCCCICRPFEMQFVDNFQNEVLHIRRPLRCSGCCFAGARQMLEVSSPRGSVIGTVEQEWSLLQPLYVLKNAYGEEVLRVRGPMGPTKCRREVNFMVSSLEGSEIGEISKKCRDSTSKGVLPNADYFGVTFPLDLDVRMKAVLLAATFLIDIMYFKH